MNKFLGLIKGKLAIGLILLLSVLLTSCGYNTIQKNDEAVAAAWSEVTNQYQRRADLVTNLVETVKGYAKHEQSVLNEVTQARSKVGQLNLDSSQLDNEQAVANFQKAQGELSSALSRLLVVAENYPDLKASPLYQDLMSQLEGTENRIAVARNRYIQAIKEYNVHIRQFPTLITAKVFGYKTKANFEAENLQQIKQAPKVAF